MFKIEGYLQALIDSHYLRLGMLNSNQKLLESYEINFIEELENALAYLKDEKSYKGHRQVIQCSMRNCSS